MKRTFTSSIAALLCIALCFEIISCTKESGAVSANSSVSNSITSTTFSDNEKIAVDEVVTLSCANDGKGEDVHVTGNLHALIHTIVNGNHFTTRYHFQPQGVKGTGLTSGTVYQLNGESGETITGSFNNGKYSRTSINNFRLVGQSTLDNYVVHENTHITINANGKTTIMTDNYSANCK